MEITKLRSQLSPLLEQVAVQVQRAWSALARLGRGAADKLKETRRASENDLRKLQASFHDAVVLIERKNTELRPHLALALEQVVVLSQRVWSALARLGRRTAAKLEEARLASENHLRKLQASFQDAVVLIERKNTELRPHLALALEQVAVLFQRVWSALARLGRGAAEGLEWACRASENDLRKLQANFHDAAGVIKRKNAEFRSRLALALEQVAVHFRGAWDAITRLGRGAADKLEGARCAGGNGLRKAGASFLEAIAVAKAKIAKFCLQLFLMLRHVAAHILRVVSAPVRLGRKIVDKPRRLREARLARENDLQTLLAGSLDGIIVTDGDHRLVAANSRGLELFGVSELNMRQFTIGTFLSHGQILDFDRNRSPFTRKEERHGNCKIRRLDGTSRQAECIFVPNVVPRRHLYRFVNGAPQKIAQSLQSGHSETIRRAAAAS